MTAWQLPDACLTTAWRLPDDYLTTAWWLPDDCLTTAWRLQYDCLKTARRLPDSCLTALIWPPKLNTARKQKSLPYILVWSLKIAGAMPNWSFSSGKTQFYFLKKGEVKHLWNTLCAAKFSDNGSVICFRRQAACTFQDGQNIVCTFGSIPALLKEKRWHFNSDKDVSILCTGSSHVLCSVGSTKEMWNLTAQ